MKEVTQLNMFSETNQDMPLISGTAQTIHPEEYKPAEVTEIQDVMYSCHHCKDTGYIAYQSEDYQGNTHYQVYLRL